jgi:vacuolar protein sorting-associated protein 35
VFVAVFVIFSTLSLSLVICQGLLLFISLSHTHTRSLFSSIALFQHLAEASRKVKEQAFYMKRAITNDDLKLVLEHSAQMLKELKTSLLSPKNYYELYMLVLDEMRFTTINQAPPPLGKTMVELYELVQHCSHVVPRLYLLIAVGSVYIKSKEAPAKDILKDLIEMVKCVQYPTRGLFLRNYLSQACRDKLPDTGSEYESEEGGNVNDAADFVLQNFVEMNKVSVEENTALAKSRDDFRFDLSMHIE